MVAVEFEFEFWRSGSTWPSGLALTRPLTVPARIASVCGAVRGSRRPARGQVILEPVNLSPRDLQWRDAVSLLAACGETQRGCAAPEGADAHHIAGWDRTAGIDNACCLGYSCLSPTEGDRTNHRAPGCEAPEGGRGDEKQRGYGQQHHGDMRSWWRGKLAGSGGVGLGAKETACSSNSSNVGTGCHTRLRSEGGGQKREQRCAEMVAVKKGSVTVWLGVARGNRMLRAIGEHEERSCELTVWHLVWPQVFPAESGGGLPHCVMSDFLQQALKRRALEAAREARQAGEAEAQKRATDHGAFERGEAEREKEKLAAAAQRQQARAKNRQSMTQAEDQVEQLQLSIASLGIEAAEIGPAQGRTITAALRQVGVATAGESTLYIQHMVHLLQVKITEEQKWVQGAGVFRARQMFHDQHMLQGEAGKLMITITETESFSSLTKDAVFQFLRHLVPTVEVAQITGITRTLKNRTTIGTFPTVYEVNVNREEMLTKQLLTTMQASRSITIDSQRCTWGFESSVSVPLVIAQEEKGKLGAVWTSLKAANFGHDDLDMMINAGVRASLRAVNPELEETLVAAAVQRYVKFAGNKLRVLPEELPVNDGPKIRVMFTNLKAAMQAKDIAVELCLGAGPDQCLIKVPAHFGGIERTTLSVGFEAAKGRALETAEARLKKGHDILVEVTRQTTLALQAYQSQVGAAGTPPEAESIRADLITTVMAEASIGKDITANFVGPVLSAAVERMQWDEAGWRSLQALAVRMRDEVKRRRESMGDLVVVKLGPFPSVNDIRMPNSKEKAGLRAMTTQGLEALLNLMQVKSVLAEEFITSGADRSEWDHEKGIVVILQTPQQLQRQVFPLAPGARSDGHGWEHVQLGLEHTNLRGVQLKIPLLQKPGVSSKGGSFSVRANIVSMATSISAATETRARMREHVQQMANRAEGIWVKRKCQEDENGGSTTIFRPASGQTATGLTQLEPLPDLPCYIANMHEWLGLDGVQDCDAALAVLGELVVEEVIAEIVFDDEWLVFLRTPLAQALAKSKRQGEKFFPFLAVGHSVRDIILEMARAHLLDTLLQFAAGGVWLGWDATTAVHEERDDAPHPIPETGIQVPPQGNEAHTGPRWLEVVAKDDALVIMSTTTSGRKNLQGAVAGILRQESSPIIALRGSEEVSLLLFANTVYQDQWETCQAIPGFPLPEIQVSPAKYDEVAKSIHRAALARGTGWEIIQKEEWEASCWITREHQETSSNLVRQYDSNPQGVLRLTWQEVRMLEKALQETVKPFLVLRGPIRDGQQLGFKVQPRGPGVVFLAAAPSHGGSTTKLDEVKAQWSEQYKQDTATGDILMLQDILYDWPELRYGTAAARILQQMATQGLVMTVKVSDVFVAVFPEFVRDTMQGTTGWQVQFGLDRMVLERELTKAVRRNQRLTLEGIQEWVHTKSSEAVESKVLDRLENGMSYVVPGLRVVQEDGGATVRFVGSCKTTQNRHDLRGCMGHPAILDERSASVIHCLLETLKVFHVGEQLDCLLVMLNSSDDYIVTWVDGAPQFQQWNPRGGATIEDLRALQKQQTENDVSMAPTAAESKRKGRDRDGGEENTSGHEEDEVDMSDETAHPGNAEDGGGPRKKGTGKP